MPLPDTVFGISSSESLGRWDSLTRRRTLSYTSKSPNRTASDRRSDQGVGVRVADRPRERRVAW
jgi:hypothetical protein